MSSGSTIQDELQALWVTENLTPLSTGVPTCSYECDITVDANGDPHVFVVVGSASLVTYPSSEYTIYSGIAKLAVDITTSDGGTTWSMHKVSPVYTFRGNFGTTNTLLMDNYPQISRSADGSHIFYSWVDSDTAALTGSQMGIGFGESDNLLPNLRIAGKRISDGFVTCPKWVTQGDILWEGRALWPTMAPEVLTDNSGSETVYKLPVVVTEMIQGDPLSPCSYWYFGNDATITESDFWGLAEWVNTDDCFNNPTVDVGETKEGNLLLYPVPAQNSVWITGLDVQVESNVELYNNVGQLVYTDAVHQTDRIEINVSDLPVGYYTVRVNSKNGVLTKPFIVAR
jgi:hypothetical protein